MSYDLIFSNIEKHISLTLREKELFIDLLISVDVAKKEFIQRQDELCPYIAFVSSGILRAFHINEKGKEITVMFATPDWWITDMNGFLNSEKSAVNIIALEDSAILKLSLEQLENLFLEIPKFERFFRILMQKAYVREQQRTLQNLSLPAEERYFNFIKKYPQIAEKISQKQMASYLGITPEFLSQIRNKKVFS